MEYKDQHSPNSKGGMRTRTRRILAALLGAWLFMVPQVMFSSTVVAFCDEYGSAPAPLVEEEEVKHLSTAPSTIGILQPSPRHDVEVLPNWDSSLVLGPHGDVPHLPPWVA